MDTGRMIDLSLILACYNDAPYLNESVDEIIKVLDMTRLTYELIFVYDRGSDDTLHVIDEIIDKYRAVKTIKRIVHDTNYGRGRSVRDGMAVAEGRVAGYIDVDLDVHPRYIPSMVSAIIDDGFDGAIGFRFYKVQIAPLSILRHILSHGYRYISRILLNEGLKDSESGYKFFDRQKVLPLVRMSIYDGWFWDTEIMAYCIYSGLKIKEIPCLFERRGDKKSSVRIITTVATYLLNLIRFKMFLLKQKNKIVEELKMTKMDKTPDNNVGRSAL